MFICVGSLYLNIFSINDYELRVPPKGVTSGSEYLILLFIDLRNLKNLFSQHLIDAKCHFAIFQDLLSIQ